MAEAAELENASQASSAITSNSEQKIQVNTAVKQQEQVIDMPTEKVIESEESVDKRTSVEECEVKPKKVPTGAFKLRGFFTRNKAKTEDNVGTSANFVTDDSKLTSNFGTRLLNVLRSFAVRKKTYNLDVEQLQEPYEKTIDTETTKDEVDKAAVILTTNEIVVEEVKKSVNIDVKKTQAIAADEVQPNKPDKQMHSCKYYAIIILLSLLLCSCILGAIYFVRNIYEPVIMQLRDGRYVETITSCGKVEGIYEDGAYQFYGIPYAKPPIHTMRFENSDSIQDIEHCWNDTYRAYNNNIRCMQRLGNGSVIGDEDCLYLDVITPVLRYDTSLPVVVLIGAESITGASPGLLVPNARTAQQQRVVFVRPNFRLGVFGFLALHEISHMAYPRTSGNYGLSDINTALKWVQLNIYHFGGNPKAVTLLGHRAGGTLVSALVTTHTTKKYITRAWVSSASAIFPGKPLKTYELSNRIYLNSLKCYDIDCLREQSADAIWAATPDTWLQFPADLPRKGEVNHHEWLVLDGYVLQYHPSEHWGENLLTGNPVLVMGATAHESHTLKLRERHSNWTAEEVRAYLEDSQIGALNLTDEVIARYNATNYKALVSIITDIRTICPLLINARLQPKVPFYVVTEGESEDQLATVDTDVHTILNYVMNTVQNEFNNFNSALPELFYNYVRDGGSIPEYDIRRRVMKISQEIHNQEDYENCNYWISKDFVPRYAHLD